MLPKLEGNDLVLSFFGAVKLTLRVLFGEHREAYRQLDTLLDIRSSLNPHYLYTKVSFYGGLTCIANLAGAEDDAAREERLARLDRFVAELESWARLAPMNYQHEYDLLMAEKSRVAGEHLQAVQLYEEAISGARRNRFVHDAALANELYAMFWMEQGNERLAGEYMRSARSLYSSWGATAKVSQLQRLYPRYFETRSVQASQPDAQGDSDAGQRNGGQSGIRQMMNTDGIIRASQLLSSETDSDRLLSSMMKLVLDNSDASRVVLIIRRESGWFVRAECDVEGASDVVLLDQPYRAFECDNGNDDAGCLVPPSVFDYCRRSRKAIAVRDAQADQRFSTDGLIRARNIRSVAGIPALHQAELKAVLYLEHRQLVDAFSLENLQVLQHLTTQLGISLEHTELRESLEQKLRELRESEERYTRAVSGSDAGIWEWDVQSGRVFYAGWLLELLGYESEGLSDSLDEFWSRLHPDDIETTRVALDRHLSLRKPFDVNYRLRTRSGAYRWLHARGQASWDESGSATRMSGSVTDITARKNAELEARRHQEALARVERASLLSQLAASIAHELSQPLTGILSNAQAAEMLLKSGEWQEGELAEVMADIVGDAKRGGAVIHGLQDLYREQDVERHPVDVNKLVEATVQLLHSEFVTNSVKATTGCASSVPLIEGNRVQIQQVLVNLLMNAVQAMRDVERGNRELQIATSCDEDGIAVWVQDRGPGIDPDRIDRMFEPMATWKPGGTGMGLAISRSIIQTHGGIMWAENRPGGGASVGFRIPAANGGQRT